MPSGEHTVHVVVAGLDKTNISMEFYAGYASEQISLKPVFKNMFDELHFNSFDLYRSVVYIKADIGM